MPAGGLFHEVVVLAEHAEVGRGGGAAAGVVSGVVELAVLSGPGAAGEHTVSVPGAYVFAEWPGVSSASADVEDLAGDGVGDDAAPEHVSAVDEVVQCLAGDGSVSVDLAWLPGRAGECAGRDRDAQFGHDPLPLLAQDQIVQGFGAQLSRAGPGCRPLSRAGPRW